TTGVKIDVPDPDVNIVTARITVDFSLGENRAKGNLQTVWVKFSVWSSDRYWDYAVLCVGAARQFEALADAFEGYVWGTPKMEAAYFQVWKTWWLASQCNSPRWLRRLISNCSPLYRRWRSQAASVNSSMPA
ncbi:MAG: hypothetical protein H5T86_12350, partial [Armatimonadetes bacterium]|nr:hypothetical protein [Armatimonadota bacterium]